MPTKVSLNDFSREIMVDLDQLILQFPMGLKYTDLMEYYGESSQRIARAIEILVTKDRIHRSRRASGTVYVFPKGYDLPRPHPELTLHQYTILTKLQELQDPQTNMVQTNFSRLADELEYSVGGTKAALELLEKLNYIRTEGTYNDFSRTMTYKVLIQGPHIKAEDQEAVLLEEVDDNDN